jgi:hypothetical protein
MALAGSREGGVSAGATLDPEEVLQYAYATLHGPTYRSLRGTKTPIHHAATG